jgi:hypothetical protein
MKYVLRHGREKKTGEKEMGVENPIRKEILFLLYQNT